MTSIFVNKGINGSIISLGALGHSGFAEQGHDVVCAVISTVLQMVDEFVRTIDNVEVETVVHEECPWFGMAFSGNIMDQSFRSITSIAVDMLAELEEQYPDNVSIFINERS